MDQEKIYSASEIENGPFAILEPSEEYKTLDDFEGNIETKKQLEELVSHIAFPELYTSLGVSLDRGFLLEGNPGNGKTFCIECIQGELCKRGKYFGVMEYTIGAYGSKYINQNSVTLNDFFKAGQQCLEDSTEVIGILYFFDEANSFMSHRNNKHQHKEDKKVLETLMMNMQNIHNRNSEEYMFFATNFKEDLDKASIRDGRIDKIINFSNPNVDARRILFQKEIDRINKKSNYNVMQGKITDDVLNHSEGLSCIDCIHVVNNVVKDAIREGIKKMDSLNQTEIISPSKYVKVQRNALIHKIKEKRKEKELDKPSIGFQPRIDYEAKSSTE